MNIDSRFRMSHQPDLAAYLELAKSHRLVPIYRQLVGDTLTPVTAFRAIQEGDWSFLCESVVGGERLGRYSFLGSGPFLIFEARDRSVRIEDRRGEGGPLAPRADVRRAESADHHVQELTHPDPLRLLEEILARYRTPPLKGLPRFL